CKCCPWNIALGELRAEAPEPGGISRACGAFVPVVRVDGVLHWISIASPRRFNRICAACDRRNEANRIRYYVQLPKSDDCRWCTLQRSEDFWGGCVCRGCALQLKAADVLSLDLTGTDVSRRCDSCQCVEGDGSGSDGNFEIERYARPGNRA